jgi:hypothetical protein
MHYTYELKQNFTGVAPEATLGAWRVFGCDGATSNDLVIKALIDAHEAGTELKFFYLVECL